MRPAYSTLGTVWSSVPGFPALLFGLIPRLRPRLFSTCPARPYPGNRPYFLTFSAPCLIFCYLVPQASFHEFTSCLLFLRNDHSSEYLAFGLTMRIYSCKQITVLITKDTNCEYCESVLLLGPVTKPCHELITYFHRFVGQLPFCWLVPELQHPAAGRGVWAAVRGRQRCSVRAQHHQHLHSRGPQSKSADGFPPYCCTVPYLGLVRPFD